MSRLAFNDWRAENAQRNYPFADDSTLTNGIITLAKSLFIDGRLYPIGGGAALYLGRITRAGNSIEFAITTEAAGDLATASYSVNDIPASSELAFHDSYGRPAGMLLSSQEALQAFSGLNTGEYTFLLAQTRFAPAVIVAQPDIGVRGFVTDAGELFAGDVWLVGEDGVVLRRDDDGSLRIDIIGDPFAARKLCGDESASDAEIEVLSLYCPIQKLNGVEPDDQGNFQMLIGSNQSLSNILRITPGSQPSSDVTKHLDGAGALTFATLRIEALGQRRLRGDG